MKKYDAVVAGYFCVDLFPGFKKNGVHTSIAEVLRPGKLIEVEGLNATPGGIVANTGLAMKRFSKSVFLNGIIGDDFIGAVARKWLDEKELSNGIKTIKGQNTAFGIVIAPPGVDRIFLESPGCSQIFDINHIDFDAIADSKLFHFGYPPLLKQFYLNDGQQLVDMFRRIQADQVVTSLDFSLPDPESESATIDWPKILNRLLPFTDIFVPSLEESLQVLMPEEYARIQALAGNTDIIDHVPLNLIREIGQRIIDCGVKIALIKSGHLGAYLFTGNVSSLNTQSGLNLSEHEWNDTSLWCKAYPVDETKIKNASGAGDSSAAAFLSAILNGDDPEMALKYAGISGRNNLYCVDSFNDHNSWDAMTLEMKSEPVKIVNLNRQEAI